MKFLIIPFSALSLLLIVSSCTPKESPVRLKADTYRGVLDAEDQQEIPFLFKVSSPTTLEIQNAKEVIPVNDIEYANDSVYIHLPVFESLITAKISEDGRMTGVYTKAGTTNRVPFSAKPNTERFPVATAAQANVSGSWEVVFSPDKQEDRSIAKGIFKQDGQKVSGTFRTTTGDYRFLEGVVDGNELKLSTFDGAHAFLFTATVTDSTMDGQFYSRNSWKEPFSGKRNDAFELPDGDSLTTLKEGYDKLAFSFPDASGKLISLDDEQFKNKVVVVQLMGSWCPNCLDETRFFVDYYSSRKDQPIAFVALAFEYAKTDSLAFKAINHFTKSIGVDYPVLLAQYGTTDRKQADEKLPMINQIKSYPTSIIIDKQGIVRKIHSGFDGPATGEKYAEFKANFDHFVTRLMAE